MGTATAAILQASSGEPNAGQGLARGHNDARPTRFIHRLPVSPALVPTMQESHRPQENDRFAFWKIRVGLYMPLQILRPMMGSTQRRSRIDP